MIDPLRASFPAIFIQRPGIGRHNGSGGTVIGSGWDIFLPAEWGCVLWIALHHCGGRAIGLSQRMRGNMCLCVSASEGECERKHDVVSYSLKVCVILISSTLRVVSLDFQRTSLTLSLTHSSLLREKEREGVSGRRGRLQSVLISRNSSHSRLFAVHGNHSVLHTQLPLLSLLLLLLHLLKFPLILSLPHFCLRSFSSLPPSSPPLSSSTLLLPPLLLLLLPLIYFLVRHPSSWSTHSLDVCGRTLCYDRSQSPAHRLSSLLLWFRPPLHFYVEESLRIMRRCTLRHLRRLRSGGKEMKKQKCTKRELRTRKSLGMCPAGDFLIRGDVDTGQPIVARLRYTIFTPNLAMSPREKQRLPFSQPSKPQGLQQLRREKTI